MKPAMKSQINPINRDLMVLVLTGMFLGVSLVTTAIVLFNQL
jgi:hypothetical protein